jgi:hypothetical protein
MHNNSIALQEIGVILISFSMHKRRILLIKKYLL